MVWLRPQHHAAGQRAVGHLAFHRRLAGDEPHDDVAAGAGSRARRHAAAPARRPTRRSVSTPDEVLPAKAKPRMAAMASGATRQVITAERSRTRRRSSLKVMTNRGQAPSSWCWPLVPTGKS